MNQILLERTIGNILYKITEMVMPGEHKCNIIEWTIPFRLFLSENFASDIYFIHLSSNLLCMSQDMKNRKFN